jgi:sugar/nucleoside kinase (ribokinase family)
MTSRTLDVVHVGSASRDLTDDDRRGWRLGGGATYSALTTARLGLRTGALVGVDASAASAAELDLLRAAGVQLELVPLNESPVFLNRETPAGRVQTCVAVGRPLPLARLPSSWRSAPTWSLVPVAGELEEAWFTAIPDGAFVSLGWQGLLRELEGGHEVVRLAPRPSRLVERADLVGVSRHDLADGTRAHRLLRLLHAGARLVVTDGPDGGRMLQRAGDGTVRTHRYRAVVADIDVDPTGAGDVFLAALVAANVRDVNARPAREFGSRFDLRFAATAASFVVEAPGLHGVPDLPAVLSRLGRAPIAAASNG